MLVNTLTAPACKFSDMPHRTLADRARFARERAGYEREMDAAKAIGCSRPLVISWEDGSAKSIGAKYLLDAARVYRVDPAWLRMDTNKDSFPWTPNMEALAIESLDGWMTIEANTQGAAAGGGRVPDDYAETHRLLFRRESLSRKGLKPNALRVEYVRGDSMLPRLQNGDAVLVDTSDKRIRDGSIYWIRYEGELYVKQIHKAGRATVIESMNKADPQWRRPIVVSDGDDFEILGRVRWVGSWED